MLVNSMIIMLTGGARSQGEEGNARTEEGIGGKLTRKKAKTKRRRSAGGSCREQTCVTKGEMGGRRLKEVVGVMESPAKKSRPRNERFKGDPLSI